MSPLAGVPNDNRPAMLPPPGQPSTTNSSLSRDIDIHHGFFTSNGFRNPEYKTAGGRLVNNVLYNWGRHGPQFAGSVQMDIVGNTWGRLFVWDAITGKQYNGKVSQVVAWARARVLPATIWIQYSSGLNPNTVTPTAMRAERRACRAREMLRRPSETPRRNG